MKNVITLGLAGIITIIISFAAYAIFIAFVSAALAPLAMAGFAVASHYSDGAVPALGYASSGALLYVLLLAAMFPSMTKSPAPRS